MRVVLSLGESVEIEFADTDGVITVSYSDPTGIKVETDLPDTSGREGVIYHEPFSDPAEFSKIAVPA